MVYNFLCKDEKNHAQISTYFCLKHRCGKKSAIFPYSVSKHKPRDYPPCFLAYVLGAQKNVSFEYQQHNSYVLVEKYKKYFSVANS